jgi:hypothetical protein
MPYFRPFADRLGLGKRSLPRFVRRLERVGGRSMDDFDIVTRSAAAEPGRLPPLLVIHDRDDQEVRHADGQALAEEWAWPGATLYTTHGLGHRRRLLTDPAVIDAAVSFITDEATAGTPAMSGAGARSA